MFRLSREEALLRFAQGLPAVKNHRDDGANSYFATFLMSDKFFCFRSNLAIAVLWAFYCPLVLSASCSAVIYGIPNIQDCHHALNWIPSARQPPSDPQSRQPRIFAEPQYLETPFGVLDDAYRPHAIVQLPKIWKHSKTIPV